MLRRPVLSAFAVVALVVGQWIAFAHEASTRHVICAKHGEQLEAAILVGADHQCQHKHWVAVEGDGGGHTECAVSHARHQTATHSTHALAPALVVEVYGATPVVASLHTFAALYRLAPKTSPPVIETA